MASGADRLARPQWSVEVDALLQPFRRPGMPGVAVGIVRAGRLVHSAAAGLADVEAGVPLDGRSNFRLASIAKQLTAAAIVKLVEEGRLRLDDTLGQVLPGFSGELAGITIEQLLQHRSGLPDYEDLMAAGYAGQIREPEILALLQSQSATLFPPGSAFRYSNSGYVLLGIVIERRSGMRFGQWLGSRLFAPIGMQHTTAFAIDASIPRRVYGYTEAGGRAQRTDQGSTSATLGDGGVYSSIDDMAMWLAALDDDRVLDAAQRRAMFMPVADEATPGVGYGHGWFIDHINGHLRHWHTGSSIGFRHKLVRFPQRELAVLVLSNLTRDDEPALTLADAIAGIVDPELRIAGNAPPEPVIR
ncbi:MAG: serine hydrolase domain-containing protein [Pseudoxanthomonas suwonensis]|nr:serine hydrolase domain-containing protein [Pseudoxanthomonas suwonensis]